MPTLQEQINELSNSLTVVNSELSKRALKSQLITIEDTLSTQLSSIASSLETAEAAVLQIQLDLVDALDNLRALQ